MDPHFLSGSSISTKDHQYVSVKNLNGDIINSKSGGKEEETSFPTLPTITFISNLCIDHHNKTL